MPAEKIEKKIIKIKNIWDAGTKNLPADDIWLNAAAWVNFCVELVHATDEDKLKQHLTLVGFDSHKPLRNVNN